MRTRHKAKAFKPRAYEWLCLFDMLELCGLLSHALAICYEDEALTEMNNAMRDYYNATN